jgi:hypothetical protein
MRVAMFTTNYIDTFIAVADDCPLACAAVPPSKEPKSIAQIQYEILKNAAYKYTSDDVLYISNGERRGIKREDFFSKGQPCFRASPLGKLYGWGIHCDAQGRIALVAVESDTYRRCQKDISLKQVKAMRLNKG